MTVDGERICVDVSMHVKELLEQSDQQIRFQEQQDRQYLISRGGLLGSDDSTTPYSDIADLLISME